MRLFVALDIDAEIRRRIADFRDQMRTLASDVRWVSPETFHVTLQFLGETTKLDEIRAALAEIKAEVIELAFRGSGFFPAPKAPRVFWVGIEADERLQQLATRIGEALHPLGFEREAGPWKPHLTLARAGSGRPRHAPGDRISSGLLALRVRLESQPAPEFGTMTAREFCLYESKLSPAGPSYTRQARYPLA